MSGVVLLLLLTQCARLCGADGTKTFSVCEVLARLQTHRQSVIAVGGELLRTEAGMALVGEACEKPLITEGYRWRNPIPIGVIGPNSALVEVAEEGALPMAIGLAALAELQKAEERPGLKLWATCVGRLETRKNFELVLRGDGQRLPNGYGHLNALPAQLVCRELKDVVAK